MFGRNALGRRLNVAKGSYRLISECPEWLCLTEEFNITRKRTPASDRPKPASEMVEEQAAVARGDTTQADVLRNEHLQRLDELIRRAPKQLKEGLNQTRSKIERGEISANEASELVDAYEEHLADDRCRRAAQKL